MYAVIETGGKQYRVELGSELSIERLSAAAGEKVSFERVLLVADGDNAQIGTPTVSDALVTADVVSHDRGDKVIVFKYRPKARHRAKKGHRQAQTIIRIADIQVNGRSAAEEADEQAAAERKARKAAEVEAERKAAADKALAARLAEKAKADNEAEAADETKTATKASRSTTAKKAAKAESAAKAKAKAPDEEAAETETKSTPATEDQASTEENEGTGRSTARRAPPKKDE